MNITESTLLMFSGGLDSTGVWWKLIENKKDIHVHHMRLQNVENRIAAEDNAVKNICEYMKNISTFSYSESTHVYDCYNNNFIMDGDVASFMAGSICYACPSIKEVAFGRTLSDINIDRKAARCHVIFNSFIHKAIKSYPIEKMTKEFVYNMLPDNLRKLTWSCRTPIYNGSSAIPCEKCETCKNIKKFI